MILFKRLRELYNSYFKKVSIKYQITEWWKKVPKLPKIKKETLNFTCSKCGFIFKDSSTRFKKFSINEKGQYIIIFPSIDQIFCHKCYPKAHEKHVINMDNPYSSKIN